MILRFSIYGHKAYLISKVSVNITYIAALYYFLCWYLCYLVCIS